MKKIKKQGLIIPSLRVDIRGIIKSYTMINEFNGDYDIELEYQEFTKNKSLIERGIFFENVTILCFISNQPDIRELIGKAILGYLQPCRKSYKWQLFIYEVYEIE